MSCEITVRVPPGIGDIFWTYQKLSLHFDAIHYIIATISNTPVQQRALEWLKLFPKVKSARCEIVDGDTYVSLLHDYFTFPKTNADYSCNRWLEDGVRLDAIDEYEVEWNVPVRTEPFKLPFEKYLLLHVSGTAKQLWTATDWTRCVDLFCRRWGKELSVILIGAEFDRVIMEQVSKGLGQHQIFMQEKPAKVLHLIRQCHFFIGHQSGLSILADNFDIPQLMVYYPHLAKMQSAWCKRENLNRIHHTTTYDFSPEQVIAELPNWTFGKY